MLTALIILFLIGYLCIALEHPLKINKAATALITATAAWIIYMLIAPETVVGTRDFAFFLEENPSLGSLPQNQQAIHYVQHVQIIESLGDIAEILFFLIGAMTIVELIDMHGGFNIITNRITTRRKKRLLWIIGTITFFMSAILDNLTTAIVMIALLRKLIGNYKERWLFAGIIIIAANSGGAWSPIGDVTTIMLWVKGNVTTAGLIPNLFLPCLVSLAVPILIAQRWLHGEVTPASLHKLAAVQVRDGEVSYFMNVEGKTAISERERLSILLLGVGCLLFVPVFKTVTHLPPFMGILGSLGVMWLYTEVMYKHKNDMPESAKRRIPDVLSKIDTPTILFFLGILLAVSALQMSGVLASLSVWLDEKIHDVFLIDVMIGFFSSVIDNVPLVAGAMATYPIADPAAVAAAADPAYIGYFVQDGVFWQFLAYCAGVGGSMLVIGSAAGVVVMGLERMNFVWYLKNISLIALSGYLAGAAVYILLTIGLG
ncbi:sodium:proton antiporter NhaD [uncultured Rikenella sp.]|uniref:sodium:proton antiporter NhaD n=1 Tax=uncultured Rikenella sp. TaxID=368003 RepID=UPI00262B625D|nr:sodium:proton antiporter NhaD [uncultured Rikenella sp.]